MHGLLMSRYKPSNALPAELEELVPHLNIDMIYNY